jgi:Holliday junction resolvase
MVLVVSVGIMNKYYKRGADFEREVMQELSNDGCVFVCRSAGSHSLIDVIGVDFEECYFVQCKFVNKAKSFAKELSDLKKFKDLLPENCRVGLFCKVKNQGVERVWL